MASFHSVFQRRRSQTASTPPASRGHSSRSAGPSGSPAPHAQANSAHAHPQPSSRSSNTSAQHTHRRREPLPREEEVAFSAYSTPSVPNSLWYCSDFMIGAGMVVLQPATGKVLLLYEPRHDYWFFPKGRKDIGESLEQAALREAYEESGYQVEFLPLYLPTNAPIPPAERARGMQPCAEPFYASTQKWAPRRRRRQRTDESLYPEDNGGEYMVFWYIGQISADAVHHADTGMPDEKEYQSHLLELDDACARLCRCRMDQFAVILRMAYALWCRTTAYMDQEATAVQEGQTTTETEDN
ncbi:hypothetical protein DAEQUDRAFT_728315 [Daedalea quercina L-15889]|uniref:Nudix hydrolase domain-containing protein n=1 Tax=Daedalea quercina L-15889 TaxID=1314783 RepID=A0A165PD20_9APHY|nr:hypothetical protein DAEQUDRAFT_728315 [Daedalea quercina L-15889]